MVLKKLPTLFFIKLLSNGFTVKMIPDLDYFTKYLTPTIYDKELHFTLKDI